MSDEDKQQYVDRATVSSMQVLITHHYIVVITLSVISLSSSLSFYHHYYYRYRATVSSMWLLMSPPTTAAPRRLLLIRLCGPRAVGATGARLCSTPSPSLKPRRRMGRCPPTIGSRFPATTVGSTGPLRRQAPSAIADMTACCGVPAGVAKKKRDASQRDHSNSSSYCSSFRYTIQHESHLVSSLSPT